MGDGSLMIFNVRRLTNLLFYSKDKVFSEFRLIGEAILNYSPVYNDLRKSEMGFPILIFSKTVRDSSRRCLWFKIKPNPNYWEV